MRDNEYSHPGREYFPVGQEISGSGHEWNAPRQEGSSVPVEADNSGGEYHQDSTSARRGRRKRRRLQPAMLAAAAAVTVLIAFTPFAPTKSPQYPMQELSAEHRAYLDAVWAAMESSDLDELEMLFQEDMARDIVVNVIAPYARRLAEEYEELGERSGFIQEGAPDIHIGNIVFQEGGRYSVAYDGEVLCVPTNKLGNLRFYYESAISESSAQAVYVQCGLMDILSMGSGSYTNKTGFFQLTQNDSGTSTSRLQWRDTSYYDSEPAGDWNLITRWTYDINMKEELSLHGEFQPEELYLSDTGEPTTYYCLHNGVATVSYSDEHDSISGMMDVVDGYTVRWSDTVSIDEDERVRLHMEDGVLMSRYFSEYILDVSRDVKRALQHDPLYHQFVAAFVRRD